MKNNKKLLAMTVAGLLSVGNALYAQESDFDLASQRSESQNVRMVPGKKLEHNGLIINPTPQQIRWVEGGRLDLSGGVSVKDKSGKFADDLTFLTVDKKGVRLQIEFGAKVAAKAGVKNAPEAYRLVIGKQGISIVGSDERGAFYGLQTLRQIVQSPACADGTLPYMEIDDCPDLPCRGVVEGFYGTPWSHEVRLSLIEFYGRFKMNSYLYGPKDDPYHSCPNWRQPYPEKEAQNIRELVQACKRNRVDFVWAIHPGQDIKWNEEDYQNLIHKFELMYGLGVRSFAIFFDDISGEGTNPVKQTELLNNLDKDFVKMKGDVTPLIVCPTDYSKLWANPTPQGSLSIYGKTLNPSIQVFWTGDVVCSDLTRETLEWVNSRIQRPAFYWWNFPVTDYARHIVMQGPVYGLETSLTNKDVWGFVSNPMEHGEASKLSLYGVADYTWNIAAYNPIDNWERGLAELAPKATEAYRTFAIHSCDTETGYRRAESWETETFSIHRYTSQQYDALLNEFRKVEAVPVQMEQGCDNKGLLTELRPWLAEFGKLGTRGRKTLELLKIYESGDRAKFWTGYVDNLMTTDDRKVFDAHKCGTMKLQPFYENAMDDMQYDFFTRLAGEVPSTYRAIGTYKSIHTTQSKSMFDGNAATYYTSGASQKAGDWVGADLGCVRKVSEVVILQGRNSVDDVDYYDHAVLESSVDGKSWQSLGGPREKEYEVRWQGDPVDARYVRLRRLDSKRTNWMSVRSFQVNPGSDNREALGLESAQLEPALLAFDKNPATSFVNSGKLAFDIAQGVKGYALLMKPVSGSAVTLRQLDAKGKTVLTDTFRNAAYAEVDVDATALRIELEGDVEIFEIVPKASN